jgi:hypothetical protein
MAVDAGMTSFAQSVSPEGGYIAAGIRDLRPDSAAVKTEQ